MADEVSALLKKNRACQRQLRLAVQQLTKRISFLSMVRSFLLHIHDDATPVLMHLPAHAAVTRSKKERAVHFSAGQVEFIRKCVDSVGYRWKRFAEKMREHFKISVHPFYIARHYRTSQKYLFETVPMNRQHVWETICRNVPDHGSLDTNQLSIALASRGIILSRECILDAKDYGLSLQVNSSYWRVFLQLCPIPPPNLPKRLPLKRPRSNP